MLVQVYLEKWWASSEACQKRELKRFFRCRTSGAIGCFSRIPLRSMRRSHISGNTVTNCWRSTIRTQAEELSLPPAISRGAHAGRVRT